MFIRYILHHRQCMSGASETTREMWSSKSRVECQPEFEPPHREALLRSGTLSLRAVWGVGRMWCTFQVVIPRDIVWLFWRRVTWHCRRVPLISDNLLHHEEHIFREECDQYSIGWSTSVLSAEEIPSGIHVDSTPLSTLFSDCWSFVVELLAGLPGLGARFVRVDRSNKTRPHPGLQDISSPGARLNPTDPKYVLM
jgi:hypothetical protein